MMRPIAQVARAITEGRGKADTPSQVSLPACAADHPPDRIDRACDIEIPRRLWSAIHVAGQPREIVRNLTTVERGALERRQADLIAALVPFTSMQTDRVALAISDMFAGFRSATRNYDEEAAVAMIDGIRRMLAPLPAWAIEQGCRAIQRGNAGLKHRFLPNDNEIYDVIDRLVQPYRDRLDECEALLCAPVEPPIQRLAKTG